MTGDAGQINLGLESFKGFLGKGVQYVLGFIGTILFARILGPTSFGGYYTLLSLVFLAEQPLRGVANAIEKRFSEANPPRGEIFGSVFAIHVVAYIVVGVLLAFLGDILVSMTNVNNASLVFFILFTSITSFVVFQRILSASGYPALQIWNDTVRSIFTFPLQLLFIFAGFGAAGMGYGLATASILTIPIAIYSVRISLKIPSRDILNSIWNYAKYSVPGAVVSTAYSRLDLLLIGFILTTGAAGQYEVAYKLTKPAILVSTVVAPALFPKISNLHSRDEAIGTEISNALSFASILAIPIFFGALAIPESLIITIYGGEYRDAAVLLVGLALYQVFSTQVRMYARTIGGIDKPALNLRLSAITLAINIVIGVTLIFEYGALGVVVATILAEFTRYVFYTVVIRRHVSNVRILPRALLEQIAAGALMFVFVEAASNQITVNGWPQLLLIVGIGAVVYSLVLMTISNNLRVTLQSICQDLSE